MMAHVLSPLCQFHHLPILFRPLRWYSLHDHTPPPQAVLVTATDEGLELDSSEASGPGGPICVPPKCILHEFKTGMFVFFRVKLRQPQPPQQPQRLRTFTHDGPVVHKLRYLNIMQIKHDITSVVASSPGPSHCCTSWERVWYATSHVLRHR